ncbi:multidrug ABC transporter permease [Geobacillus thermodenitrificans]|jgi:ABC-2 type transport system permease protein|uniref:multidrug ABC transporter permease n=1 Tax=Geobacillus thermodenitrificans TaxID=33940 RepID=UPI000400C0A5|nr:multidrug ABC transporter permease [Geobacillus thermodenitrificans]ARA96814.1 multidrug ABC transporter permease [Geobacillus thermodenitrificans]PTR48056.1 multidrug ABC transporter permease [Geobacillus thermodenitrificans]
MSRKRWSANRAMWTQNIRQIGWIAILHLLLWLAAIVLPIALVYSQYDPKVGNMPQWDSVYHISNALEALIAWLVPVLAAAGVLRYMHDKRSADFIHGLPIRRTELLTGQIVFGWLMLVVPLVMVALVAIGCLYGLDLPWRLKAADVWHWFGETIVIETFIFALGIAVGILVGQSVLHVVLTNIFLFFPAGMLVLIYKNLSLLLSGFPDIHYYLSTELERLVIPIRYVMLMDQPMSAGEIGLLLLLSLLFFAIAVWLYERRPTEAAGQALAFRALRPLFVYGVAFCTWLVGGFYFGEVERQWGWIVFGYVTFSLLGYAIAQMVIAKTWRVFHRWKGYVAFIGVMVVLSFIIRADLTGYEQRVPAEADIKQVYFGQSTMNFERPEQIGRSFVEYDQFLRTKENIEAVRAFHEQLTHDQPSPSHLSNVQRVVIGYVLKDGTRLIRCYEVPLESYMTHFRRIMESKEYKQQYYLLLRPSGYSPIREVTIRNMNTGQPVLVLAEPKGIEAFIEALKQDLWNEPVENIIMGREVYGEIELLQSDGDTLYFSINADYVHVRQWLEQQKVWNKLTE